MTPLKQTILSNHSSDPPTVGNCFQACVASLLDLPLDDVPHFCNESDWPIGFHRWLASRGLLSIEFTYEKLDHGCSAFWGYHLICGRSPRGNFLHSIVGFDGDPVFDPHPSGAMLEPESVEPWKYMFIFPKRV